MGWFNWLIGKTCESSRLEVWHFADLVVLFGELLVVWLIGLID